MSRHEESVSHVSHANRREFLKAAGVLMAATACAPGTSSDRAGDAGGSTRDGSRRNPFEPTQLAALADAVLPAALGADGQRAATAAFVAWCEGYAPVAEEMHGYGYADIRYLPADPAPGWRAQLEALDLLAQRVHHTAFASCTREQRQALLASALRDVRGDRLPAPLEARHVALALLAHWASSPGAWDRALDVQVATGTCRPLQDAMRTPLPVVTPSASGARA